MDTPKLAGGSRDKVCKGKVIDRSAQHSAAGSLACRGNSIQAVRHHRKRQLRTTIARLGTERLDQILQPLPRHRLIHPRENLLALS